MSQALGVALVVLALTTAVLCKTFPQSIVYWRSKLVSSLA